MKGERELIQKQKTHSLKKRKNLKYLNKIFQLLGNYQENTEYKMWEEKTTETDFAGLRLYHPT